MEILNSPFERRLLGKIESQKKSSPQNELVEGFSGALSNLINKTNNLSAEASDMTQKLVSGEIDNIHDVMIAAEKSKIALQFMLAVRKNILSAIQTLEQMR